MKKILIFWILQFNFSFAGVDFEAIKKKGFVQCGVNPSVIGFAMPNSKGKWQGIDVDICRAIASAVFGDANKIKLIPLSVQQRLAALQSGEVDVLMRSTTLTLIRDSSLGLIGTGVYFYDSQGILIRKSLGINNIKELNGATICMIAGSSSEFNLADYARNINVKFKTLSIEQYEEAKRTFASGRCDGFAADKTTLVSLRFSLGGNVNDYLILPENFSKEPLGVLVRQGDKEWFNIVRWILNALLEAEEYKITSKNVDEMLKSANPNIRRILGVTKGIGNDLGLNDKWIYNIIKQIGNYGEIYDKSFGNKSQLKLERGLNNQWNNGGLMIGWSTN